MVHDNRLHDGRMLNEELVRRGLATADHHRGDSASLARRIRRAEAEAAELIQQARAEAEEATARGVEIVAKAEAEAAELVEQASKDAESAAAKAVELIHKAEDEAADLAGKAHDDAAQERDELLRIKAEIAAAQDAVEVNREAIA